MGVRDRWNWLAGSDSTYLAESRFGEVVREGETAICLDCLVTFGVRNRTCPNCGGEQFWLMAKWMEARTRTRPVAVAFPVKRAARGPIGLRHAMMPRPVARVAATGKQEGGATRGAAWAPPSAPAIARRWGRQLTPRRGPSTT